MEYRQRSAGCFGGRILPSDAQLATTTANLSGTVSDPGGALIPQAKVTLTSPETGISRESVTNESGRYSFNQLPPGTYKLAVRIDGFRPYEQTGIVLDAAQSAAQNVTLTVGTQDQQVVVNAQASNLNTQNANIAADIDAKEVVELPLNLRNVYGLATLNPFVNDTSESRMLLGGGGPSTDNADQDISFLNFAGGFFGTSAYLLDGAWDTDPEWGSGRLRSFGGLGSGMQDPEQLLHRPIWVEHRQRRQRRHQVWSNAFHGDVYEFYRNSALDSNLWFNPTGWPSKVSTATNTGVRRAARSIFQDFTGRKEKTFIFGLFERLTLATPANSTVRFRMRISARVTLPSCWVLSRVQMRWDARSMSGRFTIRAAPAPLPRAPSIPRPA